MVTGSNAFSTLIRNEIDQHGGLIPFDRYMELALYHPIYGYYNSDSFALGKRGDFTTASEISPLFASCFAVQYLQIAKYRRYEHILELGAGTGRFAGNLLSTLEKQHALPTHYYIYEISQRLREKQAVYLSSEYPTLAKRVIWLETLPTDYKGVIIANEVLDALPVDCFQISQQRILERCVGYQNNQFIWKYHQPISPKLQEQVQHLLEEYALPDGYESEINLILPTFFEALSHCLSEGVILFSDYGYGQQEYYHPQRSHGTLTCFSNHRHHDDPFILPGSQDITAHVDFTRVIATATDYGLDLLGYTNQASFLLACDLIQMANELENHLSQIDQFNLHQAIKLLTMPTEMGERIKIMALGKHFNHPLQGFQLLDRRREL